jgi:hypothetical protein
MDFENIFKTNAQEQILSPEERMKKEEEIYWHRVKSCGVAAYNVFTKKLSASEKADVYKAGGKDFDTAISLHGFIPCGFTIAGSPNGTRPISSAKEYIQILSNDIKTWEDALENSQALPEEDIKKRIAGQKYTSSVDKKQYDLTLENYKYHTHPNMHSSYEMWVKDMKETLSSFGKTAMRFEDYQIAKQALEASGALETMSPADKEQLENGIKVMEELEKSRIEQEIEDYYQHAKNCGVAAYQEFTQKVPKEEIEKIYTAEGYHLKDVIKPFGFIPCGINTNVGSANGDTPITSIPKYLEILSAEIKKYQQEYENSKPLSEEAVYKKIEGKSYISKIDGQKHDLTPDNYKYNDYINQHDQLELLVKNMKLTLQTFGETARRLGDQQTADLTEQTIQNLDK